MDVADDEDFVMLGQAVIPKRMQIRPSAEALGEGEIACGTERLLAAEQQQRAIDAGSAHNRDSLRVVLLAEIDSLDLGADMLGKIGNLEAASGGGTAPIELFHRRLLNREPDEFAGTVIARIAPAFC